MLIEQVFGMIQYVETEQTGLKHKEVPYLELAKNRTKINTKSFPTKK